MANAITPILHGTIKKKCPELRFSLPGVGKLNMVAHTKGFSKRTIGTPYYEITKGNKSLGTVVLEGNNKFNIRLSGYDSFDFKGGKEFEYVELKHALINLNKKANLEKVLENFSTDVCRIFKWVR